MEPVIPAERRTMKPESHGPAISLMLAVPDAAVAAHWYARALGATELWNLGSVVGLSVEGAPFFLAEPANNGWDTPTALGGRTVRVEVFGPFDGGAGGGVESRGPPGCLRGSRV